VIHVEGLAYILGSVGAVLLLAGLVGGGFQFSGWIMPKVGKFARLLCFCVGGALVLTALAITFIGLPQPAPPPDVADTHGAASPDPTPLAQADVHHPGTGYVVVGSDYTASVFKMPTTTSTIVTKLSDGARVTILCTAEGDSVTSPVTGGTSSLWDGTTDGGFIPDVLVDTGTDQPTAPNCAG